MTFDERLELVQSLWDSLATEMEAAPLPLSLAAEIDRRLEEHAADPSRAIDWETIEREALARVAQ